MKNQDRLLNHLRGLEQIFGRPFSLSDWRKLRRLECKLNRLAEDYCNGVIETNEIESLEQVYLKKLNNILHFQESNIPVFLNWDCRGYALKIQDAFIKNNNFRFYRDWGGYGIIAPENFN